MTSDIDKRSNEAMESIRHQMLGALNRVLGQNIFAPGPHVHSAGAIAKRKRIRKAARAARRAARR